jgi:hypothetical protein
LSQVVRKSLVAALDKPFEVTLNGWIELRENTSAFKQL